MNISDFLFGVFVGFTAGGIVGASIGISNFRKGIEDGLRIRGLLADDQGLDAIEPRSPV